MALRELKWGPVFVPHACEGAAVAGGCLLTIQCMTHASVHGRSVQRGPDRVQHVDAGQAGTAGSPGSESSLPEGGNCRPPGAAAGWAGQQWVGPGTPATSSPGLGDGDGQALSWGGGVLKWLCSRAGSKAGPGEEEAEVIMGLSPGAAVQTWVH